MNMTSLNKYFRLALMSVISFLLVACGGGEESSNTGTQAAVQQGQSVPADNSSTEVEEEEQVVSVPARANVSLNWGIPLHREDGSELELYEIDGYVVAYGTDAENLDNTVDVTGAAETSLVISDLPLDTYYFAIATIDNEGVVGNFSDVIAQQVM